MAIINDNKELFRSLTSRLSSLFILRSEGDRLHINKILDDLNTLNYRQSLIGNPTDAILLMHNCCLYISPDDDIFVPKCCRLIAKVISLQKVSVEKRTFNDLMNWCLNILYSPEKKNVVTLEVLILLDALVRSTNLFMEEFIFTILQPNNPLFFLCEEMATPEILRYSLQLLEACTVIEETMSQEKLNKLKVSMTKCIEIFKYNLLRKGNYSDTTELKIKIICLRGLENIIRKFDDIIEVGLVLGIIRYYMLLGVRDPDCLEPLPLMPSSHSIPEPSTNSVREKKGGKVTKLRKHKINKQKETPSSEDWMKSPSICDLDDNTRKTPLKQLVTSDSEISDSGIQKGFNIPRLQARVRQMSLSLLFHMSQKLQKVLLTYWTSFIPESSRSGSQFLTTCILEDPSADCRTAALNVLLYMLTSTKLCLSQAESCDRTAFTPFSAILGYMIICLHDTLNLALKEKITPVLVQVLKCYAALVEATPYKRLKASLITDIIYNVHPLLQHKDSTIKTGALIVLGCILASEPIVEETRKLFLRSDLDKNLKNLNKELDDDKKYLQNLSIDDDAVRGLPSILQNCLDNLQIPKGENIVEHAPLPVKIESLKIISYMCRNYFDCLVYPHLSLIGNAICDCLKDKNIDLRLHTGRTIDCIGQSMGQFLQESERSNDGVESAGVAFWLKLINGPLQTLFEDDPPLRAVACNCLGSIGSRIFENLSVDKHFLCMTYILGCSRDKEEHTVRGAAVRSLGILAYYPILREDPGFMVDVADAVYGTLNDDNIDVRLKSSWALGNLSDVLVSNSTNENLEKFPTILIMKLLEKCLITMKYNDKIKANIARAMGNLLHLIDNGVFEKMEYNTIVESAIDCLIKTASTVYSMKVRWNACYGLSLLLKNDEIYIGPHGRMASIFATLNNLIVDFSNFKVRTTAALALSSPSKRRYYGVHYQSVWFSLIKALENLQYVEANQEYQHKDRLIEQICLTQAHLISLSEKEDLALLGEALSPYYEICKSQMKRIYEILVPEKSNIIFAAAEHLDAFKASSVNTERIEALNMLKELVVQDF